jgi:hypothetical protein
LVGIGLEKLVEQPAGANHESGLDIVAQFRSPSVMPDPEEATPDIVARHGHLFYTLSVAASPVVVFS